MPNLGFVTQQTFAESVGGTFSVSVKVNYLRVDDFLPFRTPWQVSSIPSRIGKYKEYRVLDLFTSWHGNQINGNVIAIADLGFTEMIIKTPDESLICEFDIDPVLHPVVFLKMLATVWKLAWN